MEAERVGAPGPNGRASSYVVTKVLGGPGAAQVQVGLAVEAWQTATDEALLVLSGSGTAAAGLEVVDGGRVACMGASGIADRHDAIDALLSSDCGRATAQAGLSGSCADAPFGCSTTGATGPADAGAAATAGLLFAALLAKRRFGASYRFSCPGPTHRGRRLAAPRTVRCSGGGSPPACRT